MWGFAWLWALRNGEQSGRLQPKVNCYLGNRGEPMSTKEGSERRKIHVDLPADLHQKLRIKAALEGLSIQALVTRLVRDAVARVKIPNSRRAP